MGKKISTFHANDEIFEKTYSKFKIFFNENKDKLNLTSSLVLNDEPKFFSYSSQIKLENLTEGGSGISIDPRKAKMSAVGEVIERLAATSFKKEKLIFNSYKNLKKTKNVVSPLKFMNEKEHSKEKIEETFFYWEEVFSVFEKKKKLIPAQLVYTYNFNDFPLIEPTSNGCASWTSKEGAILNGLLELIERDSFFLFYLKKHTPNRKINLEKTTKKIKELVEYFKRYELDVSVFDITTNLNIPTYLTILKDYTGEGPSISIGTKSTFCFEEGILSSILEAQKCREWIRRIGWNTKISKKREDYLQNKDFNIIQRAFFWYDSKAFKDLNFILKAHKQDQKIRCQNQTIDKNIKKIFNTLNKEKMQVYIKELKIEGLKKNQFKIVKSIVPQLQRIYLQEKHKNISLNHERIKKFEEVKKIKNSKINLLPHPFL